MNVDDMGSLNDIIIVLASFLTISEVAKRIAQWTPGKADDEIVGKIDRFLRKVLDFLAGNHGEPGDPSAIKPKNP